jgi:hypothetical protein
MTFQTAVNQYPAPGIEGMFASANARMSAIADEAALVAGTAGVTVGRFAWTDTATNSLVSNTGSGVPRGFVANELQAKITVWEAETATLIPQGLPVTVYSKGDFWARTSTAAVMGQKVFANNTTGAVCTGTAGATITGFTETSWFVGDICNAGELCKITSWG